MPFAPQPDRADGSAGRPPDHFDSPLKEALHGYFRSFVQFFFPVAHADIAWDEGFESLDTELRQIAGTSLASPMRSDSLFRVKRISGGSQLVLIHTEIQTSRDARLAERLFRYNYRSFDAQGLEVASIAILGDASPTWRPDHYGWNLWGCEMGIRFPVVKLIDFQGREEELAASRNPFALLTRAYLATRATQGAGEERRIRKLGIVRRLYELDYAAEDVRRLFNVVDWMMRLEGEQEIIFRNELEQLEAEKQMKYINSIQRLERAEGLKEGLAGMLTVQLLQRFGQLPEWASQKLAAATPETLQQWGRRIFDAGSLEELLA